MNAKAKDLSATDLLFRDGGLVPLNLPVFFSAFGAADGVANKLLDSKDNNAAKALASAISSFAKNLTKDSSYASHNWDAIARDLVWTWLAWGSGFTAFQTTYGLSKEAYDSKINGINPEDKLPPKSGNIIKDFFTRGLGRLIFRECGAVFSSGVVLSIASVAAKNIIPGSQIIKPDSIHLFGNKADESQNPEIAEKNRATEKTLNNYLANNYLPAAAGYGAFYASIQQYRRAYDKFWDGFGKKKESSEPEIHDKMHSWKEGAGKIIFKDLVSVALGFMPHRAARSKFIEAIGKPEFNNEKNKMLLAGGKIPALQNFFNDLIEKDTTGIVTAKSVTEGFATGLGFTLYAIIARFYHNLYDKAIDSIENKASQVRLAGESILNPPTTSPLLAV